MLARMKEAGLMEGRRVVVGQKTCEPDIVTPLLAEECSLGLSTQRGTTTVTFFTGLGHHDALRAVREQVLQVVMANPWLAGRLITNDDHENVQISHPHPAMVTDGTVDSILVVDDTLKLSSGMPYEDIVDAVASSAAQLQTCGQRLSDITALVSRITIVPDDSKGMEGGFVFIFSLCPMVADGHTYHTILGQLSSTETPRPMRADRWHEFAEAAADETQAAAERKWMMSGKLVCNTVCELMWMRRRRPRVYGFYVNMSKVDTIKVKVQRRRLVEYVSTNDILISHFCNTVDARICVMQLNMRGRVNRCDIQNMDAGNYSGSVLYDEESAATPTLVRQSLCQGTVLKPESRLRRQLPGAFETLGCCARNKHSVALASNWASSFSGNLHIDGAKQGLHLPIYPYRDAVFPVMIVFRPVPGKYGVLYLATTYNHEDLMNATSPLGEVIDNHVFAAHAAAVSTSETNEIERVSQLFKEMDTDGGGTLGEDEVAEMAKNLGAKLRKRELRAAMDSMDEDGSGEIDLDEFLAWWKEQRQLAKQGKGSKLGRAALKTDPICCCRLPSDGQKHVPSTVEEEDIDRTAITRNLGGNEEPHSNKPELWNVDGAEVDLAQNYKVGGQMWYLKSRVMDAIKTKRKFDGVPMNRCAIEKKRAYHGDSIENRESDEDVRAEELVDSEVKPADEPVDDAGRLLTPLSGSDDEELSEDGDGTDEEGVALAAAAAVEKADIGELLTLGRKRANEIILPAFV